jgi:hypothetical protein
MTSTIDPELARSLEDASTALIDRIRRAIDDFHAAPPHGWETWEMWRTPKPWEGRVLPNLERYHDHLQAALRAYAAGDITQITHEAGSYKGLAKDLDFDFAWMTEQNRAAVEQAISRVVHVASRIHRLGYDELERAGRL